MKAYCCSLAVCISYALLVVFILNPLSTTAQYTSIGILGTATYIGDWDTDEDMDQDPMNPDLWTLTTTLFDGELKFRDDDSWRDNWGGNTFPAGTGIVEGPNIPVTGGNYYITFNTNTLAYNFALLEEGNVGINTFHPQEILDVNGNIKFLGELMPDGVGGGEGQILKSRGDGSMEWTDNGFLQGSVGYGTWGDCNMTNITEYNPAHDPDGESLDRFGQSVSLSGELAVVGIPYDDDAVGVFQGSVAVFILNNSTGVWEMEEEKIFNPGAMAGDYFGYDVSLSGEYAVIGSPADDSTAGNDQGSASVFKRNNSTGEWEFQGPKILDPNPDAGDQFGFSVCISGEYAIVGAPLDHEGTSADQGSASIYKRNSETGVWEIQGTKIIDAVPGGYDQFGYDVSICGDNAIIGAPFDDGPAGSDQGSVSFYRRNQSTGVWELQGSKIYNQSAAANDWFGIKVSISDEYAIVGAVNDDEGAGSNQGTATVFKRDTATGLWSMAGPKLLNQDADQAQQFGFDVSISGDYMLIGACYENGPGGTTQGSATIFMRVGPVWQRLQKIVDPGGNKSDYFGFAVDIDHDTRRFVVGAYHAYSSLGKVVFGKY